MKRSEQSFFSCFLIFGWFNYNKSSQMPIYFPANVRPVPRCIQFCLLHIFGRYSMVRFVDWLRCCHLHRMCNLHLRSSSRKYIILFNLNIDIWNRQFISKIGINSSEAGLAISSVITLNGLMQWGIRQLIETGNQMNPVKRVIEYGQLTSETTFHGCITTGK